jgi:hypothetical protein
MPTLTLTSILCEIPEETDKDEIYLKYKGKKIWPKDKKYYKIDVDEEADLNLEVNVGDEEWIEIELWEFDLMKRNDHLGTFHIQNNGAEEKFTEMLTQNESNEQDISYFLNGFIK